MRVATCRGNGEIDRRSRWSRRRWCAARAARPSTPRSRSSPCTCRRARGSSCSRRIPTTRPSPAGGLLHRMIAARAAVQVVFVTNGDGYPDAVREALHRPPRQADYLAYGRLRQREALAAARRLGIPRDRRRLPRLPRRGHRRALAGALDPRPTLHLAVHRRPTCRPTRDVVDPELEYDGQDLTGAILRILRGRAADGRDSCPIPTTSIPITPRPRASSSRRSTACSSDTSSRTTWRCWPIWSTTRPGRRRARRPRRCHHPRGSTTPHWVALPLTAAEQAAKKAALHEYASQLAFMPDLLGRFLRPNELFGRVDPSVLARIAASH